MHWSCSSGHRQVLWHNCCLSHPRLKDRGSCLPQNKVQPVWSGTQMLPWGLSDTAWVWTEQCTRGTGVYTELRRRLSLLLRFVRAGYKPDSPRFGSGCLLELLCVRVMNQAECFRGHWASTNVVRHEKSGFAASARVQFQVFSHFLTLPMAEACNWILVQYCQCQWEWLGNICLLSLVRSFLHKCIYI